MKTYCFNLKNKINIAGIIDNHCVALYRCYYHLFHKFLSKYQIPSYAIQDIAERVSRVHKLFYESLKRNVKTAPPRFQKVKKYKSFSYNLVGKNIIVDNKIKIAGEFYKFFKSREIKGNLKLLTIKRDTLGDLYVYVVSYESSEIIKARSGKIVSFDFGLKTFVNLFREYGVIYLETLNLKGIQQLWGRKINDLGFCGTEHNLDINAEKNILRVGASSMSGDDVRPAKISVLL